MRKEKRLSFIIPAYNCSKFMDETLGSVLSQLPQDCELIVVDDGSTDDTLQLLREYEKSHAKLRTASIPHGGASAARNKGLDMAEGEWVAFMDCDDCLKPEFFEKALPLLDDSFDLYIFSFERVEESGMIMPLVVRDRVYESVSDFADDYVRTRHLLIYSACNKFYRRSILVECGIRFANGMSFGEDRLFNYDYLRCCGCIMTSQIQMFSYMQRNPDSASKRHHPDYFNTIIKLHKAKTDCFLSLSKGTTGSEKRAFVGYDLSGEMGHMIERFADYPEEKEENLPKINRLLFGELDDISGRYDVLIVLGSQNCAYRIERALEAGRGDPDVRYLVTGGNMYRDGEQTEAGFMAEYLRSADIPEGRIIVEDDAEDTFHNLKYSAAIIEEKMKEGTIAASGEKLRIGIVTAGFHMPRTRLMTRNIPWYDDKDTVFIPAYGEHTRSDNWFSDPRGRSICLGEIAKCCCVQIV